MCAGLTPRQHRFVDEYLIDLNATAAYKRAGYAGSGNGAEVNAHKTLRNAKVAACVAERQKIRKQATGITAERVLQELARIAFFDIRRLYNQDGTLKAVCDLDDEAAAVLSGVDVTEQVITDTSSGEPVFTPILTKKAKTPDKVAALALAMRHLGMMVEKVEHSGNVTVQMVDYASLHKPKP